MATADSDTTLVPCSKLAEGEKLDSPERLYWFKHYNPEIFGVGKNFLGYLSRSRTLANGTFSESRTAAMLLYSVVSGDVGVYGIQRAQKKFYCHEGKYQIEFETVPAGKEYLSTTNNLREIFSNVHALNSKSSYPEIVNSAVNILLNSFRDVNYKFAPDLLGIPKTLVQLLSEGYGDCKDFALSRYMLARELGVRPEHLMIVVYSPKSKDLGLQSHANVAIFSPAMNDWVVIDGTGRNPDVEQNGMTFAYRNDTRIVPPMPYDQLVPTIGITHKGVFEFDSLFGVREVIAGGRVHIGDYHTKLVLPRGLTGPLQYSLKEADPKTVLPEITPP